MSNNGIAVHDHEHMIGAAPQSTEVSLDTGWEYKTIVTISEIISLGNTCKDNSIQMYKG